ncbi:MAG: sporulation protein SpoOM [Marinomonas sp.]|jgi:sporulation-control protein|uniref:Sporulation-control protein n=1 Tax=Marinomonas communis TaxID=28254 RepID=A0A4R6XAS2_9GAMM|nr:sporulation protein [Marinomonas communis]MAF15948.1 sporulation protein SpoOM [Marinomonas sp.]MEC8081991.1 sporulation protein [Pseudomonadota bacterium]MEC8482984.1 sporulation protein [Pseudomonadota bacterium]TDR13973.1 sporulation-control protein [Marinomonas communis]
MFKKLLASVGIGKANVDAILKSDSLQAGAPFEVEVVIKGGDVAQEIQGLSFAVMTKAKATVETKEHEREVQRSVVLQEWWQPLALTVEAGETLTKTFSLMLHPEIPASELAGVTIAKMWLQTGIDIKNGIDGSDKDPLTILPSATQRAVLDFISQSGYRLFKSDIEAGKVSAPGFTSHLPCYQEYEFKPDSFSLFGVREIEVTFVDNGQETGVLLEVDRAFKGDGYRSISIPNHCTTVADVKPYVERVLG